MCGLKESKLYRRIFVMAFSHCCTPGLNLGVVLRSHDTSFRTRGLMSFIGLKVIIISPSDSRKLQTDYIFFSNRFNFYHSMGEF